MGGKPWEAYQTPTPTGPQPAPSLNQPWTAYGGQPTPPPASDKPPPLRPKTDLPSRDFVDETVPEVIQPRTFREAVREGVDKAGTQIKEAVTDIPNAVGRAVDDPGGYARGVANIPLGIIKSVLDTAGLPFTGARHHIERGIEGAGLSKPGTADRYFDESVKPGLDNLYDLQDKYGGWFGGEGNYGWTPEKGWNRLKETIATRPLEVAADTAGAVAPLGAKLVPRVKVPDIPSATTKLDNLGIDTSKLRPDQIDELRKRGNTIGWDKEVMEREVRTILFADAKINPTESMLTNSERARYIEDRMRNGQMGPDAAAKMWDEDQLRRQQVNTFTDRTRANMTGSDTRMEPGAIGNKITERYTAADDAAQAAVNRRYDDAFDPTQLQLWGVPEHVPSTAVTGLPGAISQRLGGNAKHPFVATVETAPNTFNATKYLEDFSKTGRLPNAVPGDVMPPPGVSGISWQSMDAVRKHLVGMRESARANPTDYLGMNRVIDAFDAQFGKHNPLLNEARAAHAERMKTFHPALHQAGDDIVKATKVLSEDQNNGIKQFNKLFGTEFNKGEATGAINHLKQIFKDDPEAMAALREGALEKLFINQADYQHLTPQQMATNVRQALKGPKAEIYESLFSPDELAHLQRHHEVVKEVGAKMQPTNPPRSGHETVIQQRQQGIQAAATRTLQALIGGLGTAAGWMTGDLGATTAGSIAGGTGGGALIGTGLGGPLGNWWRTRVADPAGGREAARMSRPDPQQPNPLISKKQHGALSGAGITATQDEPPPLARGGVLRLARGR